MSSSAPTQIILMKPSSQLNTSFITEMTTDTAAKLEAGALVNAPSRIKAFIVRSGLYLALLCLYLLVTVGFTVLELKVQVAIFGPEDFSFGLFLAVCAKIYCTYLGLEAASTQSTPSDLWRTFSTGQIHTSSLEEIIVEGYSFLLGYSIAWFFITTTSSSE